MNIPSNRLYQSIGETLKSRIASGEYPVGGKLPPERVIGQELGISRTVVREAIIMLEIEGIVSVRKGSGIHIIADHSSSAKPVTGEAEKALRHLIEGLQETGPFEMLEARQQVECLIVELAAVYATPEDLEALKDIQKSAASEDQARDSEWDKEFHIQLARSSGNPVLTLLVEFLWHGRKKNPLWMNLHKHIEVKDLNSWYKEHQEIVEAIGARNPKRAYNAMWNHIESTKNALYNASSALDE
ncbi:FCD domain-containing protein [Pseudovibrio sp. Tun.PSC04-5.I4]|uniref:FCD domain-containing protein n=1 Tax=Pseudovibrio sp. Tun.PSC04-5.I4 TaxID=1798213 RepID=UPI0008905FCB|nr:FCD domain-containing protein [Pseudovibrio sp. Tun.PSC04-5.I4]SDQ15526.1 DNA-binding transcriptional regulator, FadR family [Pseudovibrio sp. Tun.PSC04-5.I4]